MRRNLLFKKILGIFLCIWTINFVQGAERERPTNAPVPESLKKSTDKGSGEITPMRELNKPPAVASISDEEVKLLFKRVSELEGGLEKLKSENKELAEKLQTVYSHIGQILTQTPPTFKELITTNKIVWGILGYTTLRFITSGYYAYQTADYGIIFVSLFYVLVNGLEGGADALIRGYYIGSVLQGLRTLQSSIPKPAPTKK